LVAFLEGLDFSSFFISSTMIWISTGTESKTGWLRDVLNEAGFHWFGSLK
jgi:hypothetical protein